MHDVGTKDHMSDGTEWSGPVIPDHRNDRRSMRNTDGDIDGNTGDTDGDSNSSMYTWLLEYNVDRQYGCTGHDTSGGQQL